MVLLLNVAISPPLEIYILLAVIFTLTLFETVSFITNVEPATIKSPPITALPDSCKLPELI